MSAIRDAATELAKALKLVPGAHVHVDAGVQPSEFPALVVGPPSLSYTNGLPSPTEARFTVLAVVQADEFAAGRMWDLIADVSAAIDEYTVAVVMSANPVEGNGLPAYDIQVDFPLEQR